ncbi:MAG: hypothetical protein HY887_00800 [Deltaproteobacteria bacterium]|nr:hypothetical protein [Deltaproteobacteria bacterium]
MGAAVLLLSCAVSDVSAVPSFARQTGRDCNTCHTIYPELTPFGRNFKLTGYTMSKNSEKPYEWPPPISGSMLWSFTHQPKALPRGTFDPNLQRHNDNVNLPQEVSLFYAGRILPYFGGFIQGAYDGIENKLLLDHTDIRPAIKTSLGNRDLVLGITINNAPTMQDVLNTGPLWGFPWAASEVALTPAAATVLENRLEFQVGGTGLYAYWNNLLYAEVTLYRTSRTGFHQLLGAGSVTETRVDNLAPYWRVFLQHQWKRHSFAVGTIGMITRIFPEKDTEVPNLQRTSGPSDKFTDIAVDAQYQYLGKKHLFTAQTIWIHEDQNFQASFPLGNTANRHNFLDTYRLNLNYYYRTDNWGNLGGTWAFFTTWGSKDEELYGREPGGGSRSGKPNSNGFILEGTYQPWNYTKLTVQYTIYNKFNGAQSNYDGFKRSAQANNTVFLLLWFTI